MVRPVSNDLRERLVAAVGEGASRVVAHRFVPSSVTSPAALFLVNQPRIS